MDDASTNPVTKEILNEYEKLDTRIKVHRQTHNFGQPSTSNFGVAMAKGKYLVIHDDDDIMPPDRLKKQVAYMENNPEVGISFGLIRFIDLNGNPYAN